MRAWKKAWPVVLLLASGSIAYAEGPMDDIVTGKIRPEKIPADWIGSPTKSAIGWRYDDPNNAGNSVRIYQGDPNDPEPSKREPYVVVISNGKVIGRDGKPVVGYIPAE